LAEELDQMRNDIKLEITDD